MTFRVGNSDLKMKNLKPYFHSQTLVTMEHRRKINLITLLIFSLLISLLWIHRMTKLLFFYFSEYAQPSKTAIVFIFVENNILDILDFRGS